MLILGGDLALVTKFHAAAKLSGTLSIACILHSNDLVVVVEDCLEEKVKVPTTNQSCYLGGDPFASSLNDELANLIDDFESFVEENVSIHDLLYHIFGDENHQVNTKCSRS